MNRLSETTCGLYKYRQQFRRRGNDELGEVIGAFHQMYRQISDANNEQKKAEAALQKSFQQVEAYSRVLNEELEKGREMQINFLPNQLLQMPGWETAAFFKPARQVADDFYDVFKLPRDSIGFVVADLLDRIANSLQEHIGEADAFDDITLLAIRRIS